MTETVWKRYHQCVQHWDNTHGWQRQSWVGYD